MKMRNSNRRLSPATDFMAPRRNRYKHKQVVAHSQCDLFLHQPMPLYIQSKPFLHTPINGQSKRAARTSRMSRPGTIGMEKASCSASTCWMTVVRSVPPGSMNNATFSTIYSMRGASITSPVPAASRLQRSNLQTLTMTTN